MSDFLFPVKQTRRDFLAAGLGLGALAVAGTTTSAAEVAVTIGSGSFKFALDPKWGTLPQGKSYGFGCAIVVDSKDRIFVTSRSTDPCVAIFDRSGTLLETWSKEFADGIGYSLDQVKGTAHGLYWSPEGKDEFFYFTENAPGNRVYKTDLHGKVLYELGAVKKEGSTSQKFKFDNPTDVAVAPNGDIYIVDGYGSQLVHQFDKNFKLIRTIGGKGKDHGKFNTCHGIWVSTIKGEPEVWIADRANNRLEIFSTDLKYIRTIEGVRNPCCFYQFQEHIYVPELAKRVSIIDKNDKIVASMGDGTGADQKDLVKNADKFFAPHALTLDSKGSLYVIEWLPTGRPRKFDRV
jgi:peptidylamidoglycolate lyase